MTNLTNTFFTKVANFTQASGVIANAADKLLSYVLPKDDVAAQATQCRTTCGSCQLVGNTVIQRTCQRCCVSYPAVFCVTTSVQICGYRV